MVVTFSEKKTNDENLEKNVRWTSKPQKHILVVQTVLYKTYWRKLRGYEIELRGYEIDNCPLIQWKFQLNPFIGSLWRSFHRFGR